MDYKDIKTGDLLFLQGTTGLAKQIQKAQLQNGNVYYQLNHVGRFLWLNGILCVAEEDYPGVYDINVFDDEYVKSKATVYVGRVRGKELTDLEKIKLVKASLKRASQDRLTNYAYTDILAFKVNSLSVKWFKKDFWIGRKRNKKDRYTCSQSECQMLQEYFGIMKYQNYLRCYPADIADCNDVEILKIKY